MRISGRSMALGFASAALAVGSLVAPAAANGAQTATGTADGSGVGQVTTHQRGDGTKPPAELGNPSEWGVAKIKVNSSAHSVRPDQEACVPTSGGKWCYGWRTTTSGKYCYSNYLHGSKWHASSVKIAGSKRSSGWVKPGSASNAHLTLGLAYTCYTYFKIR